jgi:exodeoxyribonuclease V alpha subunit
MELTGTVERIIYENIETGFSIFILSDKNTSVTIRGTVASLYVGQEITIKGAWTSHPKFGKQFEAQECICAPPASINGLKKYLASGVIRGVGPVYAQRLVETFGEQVLDIIDKTPTRLSVVPGIGPKRAELIINSWHEQKNIAAIMVFLQDKGISLAYAAKIYKKYGATSVSVIRENPYRLADEVWGIGFKMADNIAHNLGFEHNCIARIKAGILFCINSAVGNGHLYVAADELKQTAKELLGLAGEDERLINNALEQLHAIDKIKTIIYQDISFITTTALYANEFGVAQKIKQLLTYQSGITIDHGALYQKLRVQQGPIQLNEDQQRGILTALQHKITIITGGPGTGKTTLIKQLLELAHAHRLTYKLAAPTGRAAKRMFESTGHSAATIHRLLEFDPKTFQFKYNEYSTLKTQMLIIDEASMIDIFLAHALLKATPLTCHVIFIGDIDQLPPVGAGNFLRDLIASAQVPCIRLTHIFRQAQQSLITINAHRVNQGIFPTTSVPDSIKDFWWVKEENPENVRAFLRSLYTTRLIALGIDPADTMVLVPMNRGTIGTHKLNQELQTIINRQPGDKLTIGLTEFMVGDRVMQLRNNYEKMVFNGDIGFIATINHTERMVSIRYGERILDYRYNELDELILAYAITVHKSQGSEYQAVIVPIFTQHFTLLARNLIYTAITRAKKLCIIIGQTRALAIAIKNNKSTKRQTFLAHYLTTNGS